jgi:hypothetical protein
MKQVKMFGLCCCLFFGAPSFSAEKREEINCKKFVKEVRESILSTIRGETDLPLFKIVTMVKGVQNYLGNEFKGEQVKSNPFCATHTRELRREKAQNKTYPKLNLDTDCQAFIEKFDKTCLASLSEKGNLVEHAQCDQLMLNRPPTEQLRTMLVSANCKNMVKGFSK